MSGFEIGKDKIKKLWGDIPAELSLIFGEETMCMWGGSTTSKNNIIFNGVTLGELSTSLSPEENFELAGYIAPILYLEKTKSLGNYAISLHAWVSEARSLAPEVCDWIGIYYKAGAFLEVETTDLYLGPYIGEYTEHQVIPLNRGLCGLALREERVVNVADVHQDKRHIACSLKTNSELIIPLKNSTGEMVAELDIDCNKKGAFTPEVEEKFKAFGETFQSLK